MIANKFWDQENQKKKSMERSNKGSCREVPLLVALWAEMTLSDILTGEVSAVMNKQYQLVLP